MKVVVAAAPSTTVDYLARMIEDHRSELQERKRKIEEGTESEPYLLILAPSLQLTFLGDQRQALIEMIDEWKAESPGSGSDYGRLINYYGLAEAPANNFVFRKLFKFENVNSADIHRLISMALDRNTNFADLSDPITDRILERCADIKSVLDAERTPESKVEELSRLVNFQEPRRLVEDLRAKPISSEAVKEETQEEEAIEESVETGEKPVNPIELVSIVGSKGLSAERVVVLGFDDVNMRATRNAFYVALTRSRRSLDIITTLRAGGASRYHDFLDDLPEEHLEFASYRKSDRRYSVLTKDGFVSHIDSLTSWPRRS